jgi:hypothetical protein
MVKEPRGRAILRGSDIYADKVFSRGKKSQAYLAAETGVKPCFALSLTSSSLTLATKESM